MDVSTVTVINTPKGIRIYQLLVAKSAIKLEKAGMRHSRIRSVRAMYARHLGLKRNATHDDVVAAIQGEVDRLHAMTDEQYALTLS